MVPTPRQAFYDALIHGDAQRLRLGTDQNGEPVTLTSSGKNPQRDRGLYIVGRPGSGKTTLIQNAIVQDLKAGHGFALLSPEQGTFTHRVLPFVPVERVQDVIYFDPLDTKRPVPLNPLHYHRGEVFGTAASNTMTILQRTFSNVSSTNAPLMSTTLEMAVRALMLIPDSNLSDIPRLLADEHFRGWVVEQIKDRNTREFWTDVFPGFPNKSIIGLRTRLSSFLIKEFVAPMLCTRGACLDFFDLMEQRKILLFSLPNTLGDDQQIILGQLIVARFQQAMHRRKEEDPTQSPFYIYLDEFQAFSNTSVSSYATLLERSRKRRCPLILAHQHSDQLNQKIMRSILGTVAASVVFDVQDTDARRLARELGCDGESLRYQEQGHCYCRTDAGLHHMTTDPPPRGGDRQLAKAAIQRSRKEHGVSPTHDTPHPLYEKTLRQQPAVDPVAAVAELRASRRRRKTAPPNAS